MTVIMVETKEDMAVMAAMVADMEAMVVMETAITDATIVMV